MGAHRGREVSVLLTLPGLSEIWQTEAWGKVQGTYGHRKCVRHQRGLSQGCGDWGVPEFGWTQAVRRQGPRVEGKVLTCGTHCAVCWGVPQCGQKNPWWGDPGNPCHMSDTELAARTEPHPPNRPGRGLIRPRAVQRGPRKVHRPPPGSRGHFLGRSLFRENVLEGDFHAITGARKCIPHWRGRVRQSTKS